MASADLNEDGFMDLVIGAPFAPSGGEQRGFIGVLYSGTEPLGNISSCALYTAQNL